MSASASLASRGATANASALASRVRMTRARTAAPPVRAAIAEPPGSASNAEVKNSDIQMFEGTKRLQTQVATVWMQWQ